MTNSKMIRSRENFRSPFTNFPPGYELGVSGTLQPNSQMKAQQMLSDSQLELSKLDQLVARLSSELKEATERQSALKDVVKSLEKLS